MPKLSRRTLLAAGLLARRGRSAAADPYERLKTDDYIGVATPLATVVDESVFTEGPAVDRRGDVYFTNTRASKILRWDGRRLSVFRDRSNAANT